MLNIWRQELFFFAIFLRVWYTMQLDIVEHLENGNKILLILLDAYEQYIQVMRSFSAYGSYYFTGQDVDLGMTLRQCMMYFIQLIRLHVLP